MSPTKIINKNKQRMVTHFSYHLVVRDLDSVNKKDTFYQQKKRGRDCLRGTHDRWRNELCFYGTMTTLYDS